MPDVMERTDVLEVEFPPDEQLSHVPPAPPPGLDTALYEHDELTARRNLRRQIAALEAELGRLFGAAFPRTGIDFHVAGLGGPRILSLDELEQIRDELFSRVKDVRGRLSDHAYVEECNRELIEEMTADPEAYRWVRVSNQDIGEPGCKHWHSRPRWGLLGMLLGWWRVKISSGCPLAEGLRPPRSTDGDKAAAQKAQAARDQTRDG